MVIMFPYASTLEHSVQAADLATKDIIVAVAATMITTSLKLLAVKSFPFKETLRFLIVEAFIPKTGCSSWKFLFKGEHY